MLDLSRQHPTPSLESLAEMGAGGYHRTRARTQTRCRAMSTAFAYRTPGHRPTDKSLHVGRHQQKVGWVSRWLMKGLNGPFVVDEPTRGIDVGAKSEIFA